MSKKTVLKVSALASAISGIVTLFAVVYPIVSYENFANQKYPRLLSPIKKSPAVVKRGPTDYTKASNWFPAAKKTEFTASGVDYYTLSVPKLGIKNATVAIGGEDLSENLIQYPGTSLPGKDGNAVVFGHSILPQFYDPENYLAIFSTLPTLIEGDEIYISYDGINYKYVVEDLFEVLPTDIQILEQNSSDSFLTLVTCTPPGHPDKPRRLIVRARVVPLVTNAARY